MHNKTLSRLDSLRYELKNLLNKQASVSNSHIKNYHAITDAFGRTHHIETSMPIDNPSLIYDYEIDNLLRTVVDIAVEEVTLRLQDTILIKK